MNVDRTSRVFHGGYGAAQGEGRRGYRQAAYKGGRRFAHGDDAREWQQQHLRWVGIVSCLVSATVTLVSMTWIAIRF
jgi:hypothetical protein